MPSLTATETSLTPDADGDYAVVQTATDPEGASHSTIAWIVTRPSDGSGCSVTPAASRRHVPAPALALTSLVLLAAWFRRRTP